MRLLVRIIDKERLGDPHLDAGLSVAGDVIAVKRDDEFLGGKRLDVLPEYRVIRSPLEHIEAQALVGPGIHRSATESDPQLFRAVKLDLYALDALVGGRLLAPRSGDVEVSREDLLSCLVVKERPVDPTVIGGAGGIIG